MCSIEAAAITFSNAGNAFAFGNPSVDSVIDRYLAKTSSFVAAEAESGDPVKELQDKLANALGHFESEKKHREAIDRALAKFKLPVEGSKLEELVRQCNGKAMAEKMTKLQIGNKSHYQAEVLAFLVVDKKHGEAADKPFAMLNPSIKASKLDKHERQRKGKAMVEEMNELQIGKAEALARLEAEKKHGEAADKAFAMLNPPVEASKLEEFEQKCKGKSKATVDEMTESELQSGNKSLRLAMSRAEILARLESKKQCREAVDKAITTLTLPWSFHEHLHELCYN